jgi:hypothetical protein
MYLHVGILRVAALMAAIGLAVVVYAGAAYALRIRETTEFTAAISRRLLRRRAKIGRASCRERVLVTV